MFRVSTKPIIRSTQNCNYILRNWSYFLLLSPSKVANLATLEGGFIVQTFIPAVDYSHVIYLANIYFKISHTYPKYSIIIETTKEGLVLNLRHSGYDA